MFLTQDKFNEQIKTVFSAFYLTMVSIIQGVAFGFLSFRFFELKSDDLTYHILYGFVALLCISAVSYEYATVSFVFCWSLRFWDVLIPLLLGFSEILIVHSMDNSVHWWLSMAVLFLFGVFAYINTLAHLKEDSFEIDSAYLETKKILRHSLYLALSGILVSLLLSFILYKYSNSYGLEALFLFFNAIYFFAFAIKEQRWLKKLHDIFEIEY